MREGRKKGRKENKKGRKENKKGRNEGSGKNERKERERIER